MMRRQAEPVHASDAEAPTTIADPHLAMLPAELLQDGEIILLMIKPSPWFIVLEPLRTLLGILLLTIATFWLNRSGLLPFRSSDVLLCGCGVMIARLLWQFLEWVSRVYVLTDKRVIRVRGVLRVHVFEASLRQIQHTELQFNIRERVTGLGTIFFTTAGTAFVEAAWTMIAKPMQVHQEVVKAIQRYR